METRGFISSSPFWARNGPLSFNFGKLNHTDSILLTTVELLYVEIVQADYSVAIFSGIGDYIVEAGY